MQIKNLMFNKVCTPIFQKEKFFDQSERSVFHLLESIMTNEENCGIKSRKFNKKTHSTMKEKFTFFFI